MMNNKSKRGPKPYIPSPEVEALIKHFQAMKDTLNEKQRRRAIALIATKADPRSYSYVASTLHCCKKTIRRGLQELQQEDPEPDRIRKPGGGRKPLDGSRFLCSFQQILQSHTFGCPQTGRIWTSLSLFKIARHLWEMTGILLCRNSICKLLKLFGYSKKKNRKILQNGAFHPNRDEQFELIHHLQEYFRQWGNPIVSVDCKKKEKIGLFTNDGEVYTPKGQPIFVEDHDFALQTAVPYGIYDVERNYGYMVVGSSHDTAEFAASCLDQCIQEYLLEYYEGFDQLLILCDIGRSNGSRNRLWKKKLKELADRYGIEIVAAHYPPGCSKYNPIEHRLFSMVSKNWAGCPLTSLEEVANYIRNTTTSTGLTVDCKLDLREYPTGTKISDKELSWIRRDHFGGQKQWNYVIYPNLASN